MAQFPQVRGLLDPVVSARIQHGPFEMNDGFRPARVRFRSWSGRTPRRPVSVAATLSADYFAAGTAEVHFRADLQGSHRPGHPAVRAAARTGRTRADHVTVGGNHIHHQVFGTPIIIASGIILVAATPWGPRLTRLPRSRGRRRPYRDASYGTSRRQAVEGADGRRCACWT
jgi:hypothetical protein